MNISNSKKPHGISYYIGFGLSVGLFALMLALAAVLIVIPKVTGSTPLTILTSSMEPSLPPGTLIVVKPTPVDDIRLGDVLTYQIQSGDPAVVSHRVVKMISASDGSRTFITKGDNNDIADANPVIAKQVKGTVWYSVPWIGYVSTAINGPSRSWIIPIIAVALLAYAGFTLAAGIVETARKKKRKRRDGEVATAVQSVIFQRAIKRPVVRTSSPKVHV